MAEVLKKRCDYCHLKIIVWEEMYQEPCLSSFVGIYGDGAATGTLTGIRPTKLPRRHTTEEVKQAFHMAREAGFMNINMDLIAGLPGETSEHMQRTMDAIVDLAPDSVTVHSLALKRAAFLNQNREQFPVAGADEVNRMIGISHEGALAIEAEPYYLYRQKNIAGNLENVGYARKGCEGLYNILIMEEKQTILALGAGASSKFVFRSEHGHRIERVENVKSVKDYIERIDEMIDRKKNFLLKSENSF